jgi:hypothetical protein
VPLRFRLLSIYHNLTHVAHEIDEKPEWTTCQSLLLAHRLNQEPNRLPFFELHNFIRAVAESSDSDTALTCFLSYLEDMSDTILSRSRQLCDVRHMANPNSDLIISLHWVVDVMSFKLKELGKFEAALDLCQRLLNFLDELEEEEGSKGSWWVSRLPILVS